MEPQLYRCGNLLYDGRSLLETPASMEPQLYRCGNLVYIMYDIHDTELQWSRNFIVAEIRSTARGISGPPRFNGAATLSLRKCGRSG